MSRTTKLVAVTLTAVAALLATAAGAAAHVTAQPPDQPAGAFTKVTFRVPVEGDKPMTRLEVAFPQSTGTVAYEPSPGWTITAETGKLDTPIKDEDGNATSDYTSKITWSGGSLLPGQFTEFGVSMQLPDKGELGDLLFFPAIQTYAGGQQVKWIQKPASASDDPLSLDNPAPFVTLTPAAAGGSSSTSVTGAGASKQPSGEGYVTKADLGQYATHRHIHSDITKAKALAIVGIVLGALGLLFGLVAFGRAGRRGRNGDAA